jgi:hypothetical protein
MPSPVAERKKAPASNAQHPPLTIREIAKQWSVSYDTVRRQFLNEPGVLHFGEGSRLIRGRKQKKYKRGYEVLRIPHTVFLRVQARLMRHGPEPAFVPAPAAAEQRMAAS